MLLQARGKLLATVPAGARVVDLHAPRLRNSVKALWAYFRGARPVAAYANIWPLTLTTAIMAKMSGRGTQVVTMHQNSLSSQYLHRGHSPFALRAALRLELALAEKVVGCSAGVNSRSRHAGRRPA